ncbi:hypothetical protein Tco_1548081 [Tanacetum coccineum]
MEAWAKLKVLRDLGAIYHTKIEDSLYQKKLHDPLAEAKPTEDRYKGKGYDKGQEAKQKQVKIIEHRRDKNTVEDHIIDSDASFHATYCKEELERFKLRSGKVRLADDKTLDITGIGDVVLKTSFGTSWTMKDVRIGMNMLASKGNVLDVQKLDIYFCKPTGLGKQKKISFIILGGSSDTSEGSENSRSFKDSGRSDKEYSKDRESSKEGGSETLQLQRSTRESRASVWYSPSANYLLLTENGEPESYSEALIRISAGKKASQRLWMFKVKEEQNGSKRYKARLVVKAQKRRFSASWAGRKPRMQIEGNFVRTNSSTEAMNEEPCSDVHQVSDEREVEVLRNFNWPLSELIIEYGVLPERGYSQFNNVSSGYLVSKVS